MEHYNWGYLKSAYVSEGKVSLILSTAQLGSTDYYQYRQQCGKCKDSIHEYIKLCSNFNFMRSHYSGSIDSWATVNWLSGAGVGWKSQWE